MTVYAYSRVSTDDQTTDNQILELFTKGTSNSEISRITGISRPTLIKWRKEWEEQQACWLEAFKGP